MNYSTLIPITITIINEAKLYNYMSGHEKKQYVINKIKLLVDESDIAGDYEDIVLPLIDKLIDCFVEIENNNLSCSCRRLKLVSYNKCVIL